MSVEEIIKSGILEDYCLNLLEEDKRILVEELSLKHPQINEELRLLQKGLANYIAKKPFLKDNILKEKIWQQIEKTDMNEKNDNAE